MDLCTVKTTLCPRAVQKLLVCHREADPQTITANRRGTLLVPLRRPSLQLNVKLEKKEAAYLIIEQL